jgi:type II secretory pathway pseudopilin PulG
MKSSAKSGFTLVEIVIVVSIFIVLVFAVSVMLSGIFLKSKNQLSQLNNIDQARSALAVFANEIRNSRVGVNGSYQLNQAGESQIIFYSNYRIANGAVARIRYYISGNDLYKGVVLPSGNPATYNLSSESSNKVLSGINNGSLSTFNYYNGDYDGNSSPLSQPVNINSVRFVKINLTLDSFNISAGATIRSLKDNLGN